MYVYIYIVNLLVMYAVEVFESPRRQEQSGESGYGNLTPLAAAAEFDQAGSSSKKARKPARQLCVYT